MPAQPMNDHRTTAYFTVMTKPCDVLFVEHHLLNEAENPTIGWNQELIQFQLMDTTTKPFKFLEGYFEIPETRVGALQDDLK
jgi:hypothetical protein